MSCSPADLPVSQAPFWRRSLPHAALLAITLMVFFVNLGEPGMYAPQEGRAGIIVRNMVDTGDYLDIQFKGHDTTEKPIFFYWLCLLSYKIFGFNEFAFRFPAAAASCLGVLLAYLFGKRIYGEKTGLVAGFVLATCLSFVNFGRVARIDIVLGVAYAWAMYLLYRGYFENMKANWRLYPFYAVLGVCVLIKGPVSVALAGLGVVIFALARRDWRIFWELKPISGMIIGSIVTCPWFIYEWYRTNGAYTSNFLLSHNVERYLGIAGTYGGGKRKPVLFYVPNLLAGALPWSVFLPFAAAKLLFVWKALKPKDCALASWLCSKSLSALKSLRPQTWFLLSWFASVFIFFSFSAYKRPDYLMPLYPCIAVLLARIVVLMQDRAWKLNKVWLAAWTGLGAIAGLFLVLVKTGAAAAIAEPCLSDMVPCVSERDAQTALQIFKMIDANFIGFCLLGVFGLLLIYGCCKLFERGSLVKGAVAIAGIAFAGHMAFDLLIAPHADFYKTLREEATAYAKIVPADAKVFYCHVENAEELIFYIPRDYHEDASRGMIVNPDGSLFSRYLVIREGDFDRLPFRVKSRFEVFARTVDGHQYPTVFCVAKEER